MNADFLLKAVFNMLGLDAEATKVQLINLQQWIIESIKKFDGRLNVLETSHVATREEMVAISQKLDAIIQHFGVNANGNDQPTANGIAIEYDATDGQSERDQFSH